MVDEWSRYRSRPVGDDEKEGRCTYSTTRLVAATGSSFSGGVKLRIDSDIDGVVARVARRNVLPRALCGDSVQLPEVP